jgi:hypothetical protein
VPFKRSLSVLVVTCASVISGCSSDDDDGGNNAQGGTGGATGSQCDTSDFIANCVQGGDSWGTEQQSGPCSGGTSIYGVANSFGPYGVRSEYNVGQGYENTVNPRDTAADCSAFIDGFGADPVGSAELKNIRDLDLALYSVFYPGCMPDGEKFPLITWGNGTCAMPEGYGPLLRNVASHGYIVVAPNSRYVAGGEEQLRGVDFMLAENDKPSSKYYQKVDTTKIGAMGHSQGASATAAAAADPRISVVILWNGGASASKPYLAVSGDRDIGLTVDGMRTAADAASVPAAWLFYHQVPTDIAGAPTGGLAGHLTLMMEPERVMEPAVAWWDMMLKGKEEAKPMFVGSGCTLCDSTAYPSRWVNPATPPALDYGHNAALQ